MPVRVCRGVFVLCAGPEKRAFCGRDGRFGPIIEHFEGSGRARGCGGAGGVEWRANSAEIREMAVLRADSIIIGVTFGASGGTYTTDLSESEG